MIAVGAWGTVHPTTISSLVRLGVHPGSTTAVLRKVVKVLAKHATIIARCRFAAARRGMPASS